MSKSTTSSISCDNEPLANFQAALMELLYRGGSEDELLAQLQLLEEPPECVEWIRSFDPRMAALAGKLTRQWGTRIDKPATG